MRKRAEDRRRSERECGASVEDEDKVREEEKKSAAFV